MHESLDIDGKPKGGHYIQKNRIRLKEINNENERIMNMLKINKPNIDMKQIQSSSKNLDEISKNLSLFPSIKKKRNNSSILNFSVFKYNRSNAKTLNTREQYVN